MTRSAPARLRQALARPPRALAAGLLALAGVSAAGLLAWALQGASAAAWPVGLGLWLAVGAGAWHGWRHWPQGWLEWDGHDWWLEAGDGGHPALLCGSPQVGWDGQGFLLLCVTLATRRRRWLWLEAASGPALWGDLRRAVYWRARPADGV